MLPQIQNKTLQPPKITSIPAPVPRVELVSQPPRGETQDSEPTPTPRDQPSAFTILDQHSNLWITFFTKYKKIPQILKTRKTQVAPRQVQHQKRHFQRNFLEKNCTQAAQHLVCNHLFKLYHAFHIFNNQGKKETIDTVLTGCDRDTWQKDVVNELGILANEIDNQVRATNTIQLIRKEEVPKGCTVTFDFFVCAYLLLK